MISTKFKDGDRIMYVDHNGVNQLGTVVVNSSVKGKDISETSRFGEGTRVWAIWDHTNSSDPKFVREYKAKHVTSPGIPLGKVTSDPWKDFKFSDTQTKLWAEIMSKTPTNSAPKACECDIMNFNCTCGAFKEEQRKKDEKPNDSDDSSDDSGDVPSVGEWV